MTERTVASALLARLEAIARWLRRRDMVRGGLIGVTYETIDSLR